MRWLDNNLRNSLVAHRTYCTPLLHTVPVHFVRFQWNFHSFLPWLLFLFAGVRRQFYSNSSLFNLFSYSCRNINVECHKRKIQLSLICIKMLINTGRSIYPRVTQRVSSLFKYFISPFFRFGCKFFGSHQIHHKFDYRICSTIHKIIK